jgi:hypothetical protein
MQRRKTKKRPAYFDRKVVQQCGIEEGEALHEEAAAVHRAQLLGLVRTVVEDRVGPVLA